MGNLFVSTGRALMDNIIGISRSPLRSSLAMTLIRKIILVHVISRSGWSAKSPVMSGEAPKVTRNPCDDSIYSSGIYGIGNLFVSTGRALTDTIIGISRFARNDTRRIVSGRKQP